MGKRSRTSPQIAGNHSAHRNPHLGATGRSPVSQRFAVSQFLRTSAIRDLQRSDELSRFIFSLPFALVAIGASLRLMSPGPGRVGAWLFALAPVADSAAGLMLLARRLREPATATMLDLISREYRQVETRLRLERYSRLLMFILLAAALLLLILSPRPVDHRENAYDALGRMAVVTAFLAVAWRKAKSRSIQIHRDWSVTSRT